MGTSWATSAARQAAASLEAATGRRRSEKRAGVGCAVQNRRSNRWSAWPRKSTADARLSKLPCLPTSRISSACIDSAANLAVLLLRRRRGEDSWPSSQLVSARRTTGRGAVTPGSDAWPALDASLIRTSICSTPRTARSSKTYRQSGRPEDPRAQTPSTSCWPSLATPVAQ